MREPLLSVRGLKVYFDLPRRGTVRAVDGVTFDVFPGETLGLVGESGCGKSTTGRALLRLVNPSAGEILYHGSVPDKAVVPAEARRNGAVDLAQLSGSRLRPFRRRMQMIFQDPHASLNPRMTVGASIAEPIRVFGLARGPEVDAQVQELMHQVGLPPRLRQRYPHEFSGGQRQRIGIARALAARPDFVVADEPISALDASIQAQILILLRRLQEELHLTYLFISHDLRAVGYLANRVAVMYLGEIVELAPAKRLYEQPRMPYTRALLSAVPVPDPQIERQRHRLVLAGDVPSPIDPPAGCRFHPRCSYAIAECTQIRPRLREITPGHLAACIRIGAEEPDIEQAAAKGIQVQQPD